MSSIKNLKKLFIFSFVSLSIIVCSFMLLSNVDNAQASENEDNGFFSLSFDIHDNGILDINGAVIGWSTLETEDMKELDKKLQEKGKNRDFINEIKINKVNTIECDTLRFFNNCKKINIEKCNTSMTHINKHAISNMHSLERLEIGDALWKWSEACVCECPNLKHVELDYTHKSDYDTLGNTGILDQRICPTQDAKHIEGTDVYMFCHIKTDDKDAYEKEFEATGKSGRIWHEQYSLFFEADRLSRTQAHCKELPMKNNRKVFEVQSTDQEDTNYIDGFSYHYRGYAGHPEREKSVQFFVNKNSKEIRFFTFYHPKAHLHENKYFLSTEEDANYTWIHPWRPVEKRNGETLFEHDLILPNGTTHLKLINIIESIELDPKINVITSCSFRALDNLKEVKFIKADQCATSLELKTDAFSECSDTKFYFKKSIDAKKLILNEWWASHGTLFEII